MRNLLIAALLISLVYASCETTSTDNSGKSPEGAVPNNSVNTAHTYSCPMHSNITGNQGDKCSECGMDLTATGAKDGLSEQPK